MTGSMLHISLKSRGLTSLRALEFWSVRSKRASMRKYRVAMANTKVREPNLVSDSDC